MQELSSTEMDLLLRQKLRQVLLSMETLTSTSPPEVHGAQLDLQELVLRQAHQQLLPEKVGKLRQVLMLEYTQRQVLNLVLIEAILVLASVLVLLQVEEVAFMLMLIMTKSH